MSMGHFFKGGGSYVDCLFCRDSLSVFYPRIVPRVGLVPYRPI